MTVQTPSSLAVRLLWLAPGLLVAGPSTGAPPVGGTAGRHPTAIATPRLLETSADPSTTDPSTTDPPTEPDYIECTADAPIRLAPNACVNQATVDAIDQGWHLDVNPDGTYTWTPPPSYNPTTGQWGNFDGSTQACNPTIEVKLKQAALAGSQVTRAISDKQMQYPQTDPIEVVNNPQKDGAGGVCTIDVFAFDLGRLLGSTYEQIKNMIDMLSNLSVDSLFGAACKVVNSIFGNLQNQLLSELQSHTPLTAFQQFVNSLTVGYIAPLASFTSYGSTVRPTTATLAGIVTSNPLQVSYVPDKGYVYLADLGSGNLLVVTISETPLSPADTVTPTP